MSTQQLIERYLDAFNQGDSEEMLACLHEEVAHDVNEGPREIGKDRFREFNRSMSKHYKETLRDIVIITNSDGSRAAAEFIVEGQYLATALGLPAATGQKYKLPAGIFFEVRDDLISRVTTYYNLADWTAQVVGA